MGTFPAAQSLLSPAALLELVVGAYDVGRPVDCWLWSANFSDTYFALTERGRFALRVHRTGWRTDGEIAYELEAIRHLATKGVSVATPVAAIDGSWLRVVEAPEGPRQMVLFHEAAGREAYADPGYPEPFGRSMAELHAAGDAFHSDQPRFKVDLTTLLDRPLACIEPELAQKPDYPER